MLANPLENGQTSAGTKTRLCYRHDGQKGNVMNYRLIVHYEDTGVVTIQQFADLNTIKTITNYLYNATESGARLAYEIQQRSYFRGIETIDYYGDVGRWKNDNWDE